MKYPICLFENMQALEDGEIMPQINQSLIQFRKFLEHQKPIIFPTKGKWEQKGVFSHFVSRLISGDDKRISAIGRAFCEELDGLEKTPVIFNAGKPVIEKQKRDFAEYLKTAKVVKKTLKTAPFANPQEQINVLARKVAALKYRIEAVHGGLEPKAVNEIHSDHQDLLRQLLLLAARWKRSQILMPNKKLSERDALKLQEACRYLKFAKLLVVDTKLQETFFTWIIRDNNGVRQFVEFPETSTRITTTGLAARVGRFGGEGFSIKKKKITSNKEGPLKKVIRLPFFNGQKIKNISILNEAKIVTLNGGYQLTIQKILELFQQKPKNPGDLEFFDSTGVMNWNPHNLGWWNPQKNDYERINLDIPQWWNQLPVLESLTKAQVEAKYQEVLRDKEWIVAATASREKPSLELAGSHGYLEIAIPLENGSYGIYYFGKLAARFPRVTTLNLLKFLVNTVPASIVYPDENVYYPRRQFATFPLVVSPEKGEEMMKLIREDMIKAREGNLIFQLGCENCAYWAQATLQKLASERVPNLFKFSVLDSDPSDLLFSNILKLFRKAPKSWQPHLIGGFDLALGSWRGLTVVENGKKIFKSTLKSPYRQERVIFQPAFLHKQIQDGKLKGVISAGYSS
jgi:hypothetical protein